MPWKPPLILASSFLLVVFTAHGEASVGDSNFRIKKFDARSCANCHSIEPGLSHSSQGLDCLSCHSSLATDPNHTNGGIAKQDNMLKAAPRALCASCHSTPENPASALAHALADGRAHLQFAQPKGGAGLDQESRQCLSCHDGSTAASSGVRVNSDGGAALGMSKAIRSMHPIGVAYDSNPKPHMTAQYWPQSRLPGEIRLFSGKLGCGSCHSVYAGERQMLAREPKRGDLCLDCHIK
jgi:predicted CXXCH cytochrome family protein